MKCSAPSGRGGEGRGRSRDWRVACYLPALAAKTQLNVTISERNFIKIITRICKANMLNKISINYFCYSFEKNYKMISKYFTDRGAREEQ